MSHELVHHHHHDAGAMDVFGFWIYILSDCILFGMLFGAYAVLHANVYGGPMLKAFIDLPYVLGETLLLLGSSFTYGMGILAMYRHQVKPLLFWLGLTFALGLGFVGMEVSEFIHLIAEGHGYTTSAGMSSFFTLVGTHGLHVSFGLLWMLVLMVQLCVFKLSPAMQRRLTYLGLFWAFLDVVWIFVFTIVYLMGAV